MRKLLGSVIALIVLAVLGYGYLVWQNNRAVVAPDPGQLKAALDSSIDWLESNQDGILGTLNPMLWHMIQRAAELSDDRRLKQLFERYEQRYLREAYNNPWRPLFYPGTWTAVRFEDMASWPYYNWHFMYAITCDKELQQAPAIAAQNEPGFCDQRRLSPACVTHQLMGIRLLQDRGCGNPVELQDTVQQLQQRIYRQLTWDPRVVDVYLQRVLMLAESGAGESIKPVWVQNIIDAQQPDGGWGGFDPRIPIGSGQYLGFGGRGFNIGRAKSDFHATAQGVLLFSILTSSTGTQQPRRQH